MKKKVIVVGPPSSMMETNLSNAFDIYPNPTTGTVYLIKDNNTMQLGNFNLKITGIDGKIMMKKTGLSYSTELDISDYPNGIYLFIVTDNKGGVFRKKLVKN